ncbi:MAG TPA: serine hydrolase [Lacipirellulaceae bacterium]|nr:serine hydrolase [Lacipirellulaceae bacterium]
MKTTLLRVLVLVVINPAIGDALDLRQKVDPLAKRLLADKVAVGFVVGVYKNGETQVIGYGEVEQGKGIAPSGNTIYEIGSVSKVFTGVLLADLVDRGRVKLDEPMQTYLSDAAKNQLKNPTHITFEHLATHTSGLPKLPDNMQPADPMNPYADYTFKQMFEFLKEYKLERAPGQYEYSNFGMGLLGVLLSSREKMPYEKLMVERIAKPCGMNDTCVTLSESQHQRLAPPYDSALQPAKNWDMPAFEGTGGIRSTANDMLKFIAANLANDDKPLTKAFRLSQQKRHSIPNGQAIGLAWHIARDGITRWQNGMTGGYATWLAVVPSRKAGVVVLCNTAANQIDGFGEQVTRIACGEHTNQANAPTVVHVKPEVLKKYEGVYAISPQFALTVTLDGDKLMVQGTGQQALPVVAESETKFYCKVIDAYLFFVADKNGKVNYVVLHQNGVNQTATRQKESHPHIAPVVQVSKDVLKNYEGVYAITPQFALTVTLEGDKLMVQATGQQKF